MNARTRTHTHARQRHSFVRKSLLPLRRLLYIHVAGPQVSIERAPPLRSPSTVLWSPYRGAWGAAVCGVSLGSLLLQALGGCICEASLALSRHPRALL